MEKLIRGVNVFRNEDVKRRKKFYAALAAGQKPQCLFITCSDSRIVVSKLTKTEPGDVFVLRNAGNIVPAYAGPPAESRGEWATIEYGLAVLNISDIVVCGHTQCGAMSGLLAERTPDALPSLPGWLAYTGQTRERVEAHYGGLSGDAAVAAAAMENVLQQLENLSSHPLVQQRLADEGDALNLHGWMYDLPTGTVSAYDGTVGRFVALNAEASTLPQRQPGGGLA